jgi:ADP-ribose pyrophosphatase
MQSPTLRPWKTLSRQTILQPNRFLTVENHIVELPDGRIIDDWSWLILPDASIVMAQTKEGMFLCFRQTKYAISGTTLALVAGMLESGESPLEAAQRELLEETGYGAPQWTHLGSYCADPNRGVNTLHLYLARQAYRIAQPDADDLEDQQMLILSRKELEQALRRGEFKAIMWSTAAALALLSLEE